MLLCFQPKKIHCEVLPSADESPTALGLLNSSIAYAVLAMAVFQLSYCWRCSQRRPRALLPYAYCLVLANCCRQSSGQTMSAFVYDFPGPVPGGSSQSCVRAYRRVARMDCEDIQSFDPRILVRRCYFGKADAHGVIAFYADANSTNQQVFRARITGPEVVLPGILYCGHSAAYAEYTVPTPDLTTPNFCTCTKTSRMARNTPR